jgi:23S rRNA pseudouridine2457 synthase
MTAAVGHPTLRLIRKSLANLELGSLPLGQWKEIEKSEINF